jgi:hypothetical protein
LANVTADLTAAVVLSRGHRVAGGTASTAVQEPPS